MVGEQRTTRPGTYLADVPAPGAASRTLLHDCFVGGTVNVISGPGAATLQIASASDIDP